MTCNDYDRDSDRRPSVGSVSRGSVKSVESGVKASCNAVGAVR